MTSRFGEFVFIRLETLFHSCWFSKGQIYGGALNNSPTFSEWKDCSSSPTWIRIKHGRRSGRWDTCEGEFYDRTCLSKRGESAIWLLITRNSTCQFCPISFKRRTRWVNALRLAVFKDHNRASRHLVGQRIDLSSFAFSLCVVIKVSAVLFSVKMDVWRWLMPQFEAVGPNCAAETHKP